MELEKVLKPLYPYTISTEDKNKFELSISEDYSNSTTQEHIVREKSFATVHFPKQFDRLELIDTNLGETLLFFLNKSDKLINCLEKYIKEYPSSINFYDDVYPEIEGDLRDILQKRTYIAVDSKLRRFEIESNISPIISGEFSNFLSYIEEIKGPYLDYLEKSLKDKTDSKAVEYIKTIKRPDFENILWIKFLKLLIISFKTIVEISENAFIQRDEKSNIKRLNYPNVELPKVNLEFDFSYFPARPVKQTYTFSSLEELCYITIYHLSSKKMFIKRCRNCNKYFIPHHASDEYCYSVINPQKAFQRLKRVTTIADCDLDDVVKNELKTCSDVGKYIRYNQKRRNTKVDKLYGNLQMRIKYKESTLSAEDKNLIYLDTLLNKIQKAKTTELEKYKSNENDKRYLYILQRYLTIVDKAYQKRFPPENPNRNTCKSSQYWYMGKNESLDY